MDKPQTTFEANLATESTEMLQKLVIAMHHSLQCIKNEMEDMRSQVNQVDIQSITLREALNDLQQDHHRLEAVESRAEKLGNWLEQSREEERSGQGDIQKDIVSLQGSVTLLKTILEKIPGDFRHSLGILQEEHEMLEERLTLFQSRLWLYLLLTMMLSSVLTVGLQAVIRMIPGVPAFLVPIQQALLG